MAVCGWQNDLVHGWGLDFKMGACTSAAPHLKIGVVDSEWITHLGIPSLGRQGNSTGGGEAWKGVSGGVYVGINFYVR